MKIFFDCEFTGLHAGTTLISIGLMSENNKMFYAEFNDYDKSQINPWIEEHVIKNLLFEESRFEPNRQFIPVFTENYCMLGNKEKVKKMLVKWLSQFDSVQMWSDCLSYDWVLFNDIFGTAFDIPENVNYIPQDICTLFFACDIDPDISREEFVYGESYNKPEFKHLFKQSTYKHNSLYDAYTIMECYNQLMFNLKNDPSYIYPDKVEATHSAFYGFYNEILKTGKVRNQILFCLESEENML